MKKTLLTLAMALGLSSIAQAAVDWATAINIAEDKNVTAMRDPSHAEGYNDVPYMTDGNTANADNTKWNAPKLESATTPTAIVIDLGKSMSINGVQVYWNRCQALAYDVYVSDSDPDIASNNYQLTAEWIAANAAKVNYANDVATDDLRTDEFEFTTRGRYVVFNLTKADANWASIYGYEILEIRVAGDSNEYSHFDFDETSKQQTISTNSLGTPIAYNFVGYTISGATTEAPNDIELSVEPSDGVEFSGPQGWSVTFPKHGEYTLTATSASTGDVATWTVMVLPVVPDWDKAHSVCTVTVNPYAVATQSHEGIYKATTANDGVIDDSRAGWADGELRKLDGSEADNNTLEKGANWWMVDLGRSMNLQAFKIYWEGAYSTEYDVEFYDADPTTTDATPKYVYTYTNTTSQNHEFVVPTTAARYVRINLAKVVNYVWGAKFFEVLMYSPDELNIIEDGADWSKLGSEVYSYCTTTWNPSATAYGSSNTSNIHLAALANDGLLTTRWEIHDGSLSPDADSNWWYVDLGRDFDINSFKILWEMAYCKTYELQFISAEHVTNPANINWDDDNVTTFIRTISNPIALTDEEKLALGMTNPDDPTVASGDNCFWEEFVMPTKTARYVRINGVDYAEEYGNANNGGCMKILEVLMTGPEQSLFTTPTAMILEPNAFEVGTTLNAKIVAYNDLGSKISGIEYEIIGVEITDNSYVEGLDNATLTYEGNGQFTATEVGGHLVKVTAKDASGNEFVCDNVLVEALVPDWSLRTNIAKQFELKDNASVDVAFGYNKGNPLSTAYASHGGSTALNSIDASGNTKWVVTQADIAENGNVWWLVDLGADYNVSALELVWGQYSYAKQFDVYMAGDDGSGHPTWYPATAEILADYLAYSENNANPEIKDGYAYENHAVVLQKARYIMIKPTQTRDGNSSYELAEVLVYGSNEEANTLKIMTPQFDRSREGYRGYDNPEVATSVNASDPLILSFEALTTFGTEWYNPDYYEVAWNVKFNGTDVDSESEAGYTITTIDRQVKWRDYTWKYPFLFRPKQVGTYTVSLTISEKNGTGTWTSDELSVYSVTTNKNVARYADTKENNVEVYGGGGEPNRDANDLRFDRDDTNNDQPSSAIDGNYGSWYVVGYHYRSQDAAGVEGYGYKYPANATLDKPYELIIEYPSGLYLKEMNLVEVQWEGAYAKDYEVWVQYADVTEAGAADGYPATGEWERVAAYTDLHMPGIDQHETQQIYKKAGETAVAARAASYEAWKNVKAVKIVMQKTGTEWGFKMWETSVYGLLNEQPVTVSADQMVYADPAGTARATDTSDRYYSFDVELKVDEYPSALDLTQIKNYRIISTIETNLDPVHNMLSHYSYVNDGGTERSRGAINQIVNGSTREKTFEPFIVAANADGTMPNVMIEDVDPFGGYQFAVYPIGAYDASSNSYAELGNEYAGASSNIVSLVAPTVTYSASKMTIEKMDDAFVIDDYGNVVGDVLHGNSSLPQEIRYANRIRTTDGEFTEVKLIDRTLEDWEVKYQVYMYLTDVTGKAKDISGADTDEPYLRYYYASNGGQENFVYEDGTINENAIAMNQDKPLALNRGNMSADLFYLPATVKEAKVAIDGAPADVNELTYNQFEVDDLSARITVYMYYTRLDLAYERGEYKRSKFTSQMCRVKSSEVPLTLKYEDQTASKLANITVGNNPQIVAQVVKYNESEIEGEYDIHSYYSAVNRIELNTAEDLNRYVGYHMSNEYSYTNKNSGGIACAANSGNNAPWYIEGFYNQEEGEVYADKHNANLMASEANHVSLMLAKVGAVESGLVDGKVEDDVDDIYTVLFAEYPILLQQPIDGGQVYNNNVYRPRPEIIGEKAFLDDYRENEGIATAAVNANGAEPRVFPNVTGESGYFDVKIQNVGNYTHVVQDLQGATTDIEDVVAEMVGDFRIYPNPAVDVVNVAASMELGRVEIYSIDGSLVKVVEADDTQAQIAVGDLSKGTYIVRAVGKTERLIKM